MTISSSVHENVSFFSFLFFSFLFKQKDTEDNMICLFLQMATYQWDLKSNYMLAFTVCKYDSSADRWTDIARDLADHLVTTPQVRVRYRV